MANLALPGNPRYQPKDLIPCFGYDNLYRRMVQVEIATMKTLGEIGVIPADVIVLLTPEVEDELLAITTTEVDTVEKKDTEAFGKATKHDIRALVRIMQSKVDPKLRRWIHVPLTSYDVIDTARILQFVEAHKILKELTNKVIKHFIEKINEFAGEIQIGRTHGQHAIPITVGFWFATILNRIVNDVQGLNSAADRLVGKISGAVGAYNAQKGLGISKACSEKDGKRFEERVLDKLGLKSALISTQILPPEPLADYLFACIKLSATFGQFGRDGRNLMRTEIDELCEPFEKGQVGSSTMAHKRNPINFENLESTWLKNKNEFGKVLDTMISEHQRDLVNSAISRDFPTILVNLVSQLNTLLSTSKDDPESSFISRISVNKEACRRNFDLQGSAILAEPIYIALQMAGYEGDAHDLVNHTALPFSVQKNVPLLGATQWALREILGNEEADKIWSRIPDETMKILGNPKLYIGSAKSRAGYVVVKAQEYLVTQ